MKLEKGKWYKWFQTCHATTHIGKFDSISNNDTVRMKPWIVQTTSYNVSGAFESKFMQDIVEITDLTEIQKLLPDEPKVDKVESKSERYTATMKFFEQLREPERSQAIEKYNEYYSKTIPLNLHEALASGFEWDKSKQGRLYWGTLYKSTDNNTYFKEETKDYKEAVHCTTQEEWDFVLSKFNTNKLNNSCWDEYKEDTCLNVLDSPDPTNEGCYCNKPYYLNKKYIILTFKQWCDKYNQGVRNIADIKPTSLKGRYIKCLKENGWDGNKTKVGQVLEIKKVDKDGDLFIGDHCLDKARLENGQFELLPIDYAPNLIQEETMFKKGDYIVTLINDGWCGKLNYCSKQRYNKKCLSPEIDTKGDTDNGNNTFTFSDKSQTIWRFGTKEEGEEYERHGKPYDVGSLLSSKIPDKPTPYIAKVGDIVKVIRVDNNYFRLGDIVECISPSRFINKYGTIQMLIETEYKATTFNKYDTMDVYDNKVYPITPKEVYPTISIPKPTTIILKTKSKSIKL
jgi:hypothetical protein